MELYVLRHAIAAERGPGYPSDSERPLTQRGRNRMRQIAKAMKAFGISFDVMLSSPYVRAYQTAEIVADVYDAHDQMIIIDELSANSQPQFLVQVLKEDYKKHERIVVVGHEPFLSELISMLISGHETVSITMKKGGLCGLHVHELDYDQCATLMWLLTSKQLRMMA